MFGERIAVAENGLPWVIDTKGRVHSLSSSDQWIMTYTKRKAKEIAIGPKNDVWILSGSIKKDYKIYKISQGRITWQVGKARKITIDKHGDPWIVMSN